MTEGAAMATTALTHWQPKPQQIQAARYVAIGCPWQYTLDKCGISRDTLARWLRQPGFAALVDDLTQRAFEYVEPDIWRNVRLALDLQRQLFAGEIPPDDGRIPHADKLLDRFLNKLTAVAVPADIPIGPAAPSPAAAIQINHYNGTNGVHTIAATQPIDYSGAIESGSTNGAHQLHDPHDG